MMAGAPLIPHETQGAALGGGWERASRWQLSLSSRLLLRAAWLAAGPCLRNGALPPAAEQQRGEEDAD